MNMTLIRLPIDHYKINLSGVTLLEIIYSSINNRKCC